MPKKPKIQSSDIELRRTRNWCCVVYQDSAPEDWFQILTNLRCQAVISPYHDKDINADGEPKKPHWHVMLMFPGNKSVEQIQSYMDLFGGVFMRDPYTGQRVEVASANGMARYFCHLDNPDKHLYDTKDVRTLGGVDYFALCNLTADKYRCISEMCAFCDTYKVYSYSALFKYACECRYDWFRVLCDNGTYVMKEFLRSRRCDKSEESADSLPIDWWHGVVEELSE